MRQLGWAGAFLVFVLAVTMAGAIVAMLVSAWMVEGTLEVVPFAIFGAVTTFAGVLAARVLLAVPDRLAAVLPVPEPVSGR